MAGVVAIAAAAVSILSVNIFPNVTNDSVTYLGYSRDLVGRGFVHLGYRQAGYPLILSMVRVMSPLVGIEALLLAAFLQRLLMVIAVAYAIWLWRWRSLPVVVLMATPSVVAYTNMILTEGLSISLALIMACAVSHHFEIAGGTWKYNRSMLPLYKGELNPPAVAAATAILATAVALALFTLKFPFAVFGLVPVVLWLGSVRRGDHLGRFSALLIVFLISTGALSTAMAKENSEELGVFSPTARGERARYWSAWQLAFTVHAENREDAGLSDFFDGGSPYHRIWGIEAAYPSYVDQAIELETAIANLLEAAGLAPGRERVFSFLGALGGGRIDDVGRRVEAMIDADAFALEEVIHMNDVSRLQGIQIFNARYNDGHTPQAVVISPVIPRPPLPYVSTTLGVLLPLALVGIVVASIAKRRILLGACFLVPTLAYAAAMGWILDDNLRFLLTTSVYAVAGLSALWVATPHRSVRPTTRPSAISVASS